MRRKLYFVLLFVLVTVPAFALPASPDKASDLAGKVQQQLTAVSPHVVIVVVDSRDNTAYVSGTVSSQAEADRITEMIRSMEDVNLVNANLSVSESSAGSMAGQPATTGSETATGITPAPGTTGSTDTTGSQPSPTTGYTPDSADTTGTPDATGTTGTGDTTGTSDLSGTGETGTADTTGDTTGTTDMTAEPDATGTTDMTADPEDTTATDPTDPSIDAGQEGSALGTTSDASITQTVEEALQSEGLQQSESFIRVETENGVVTLTGTALSEAQADRIVEVARRVPGVVDVEPNLQLRDEQRRYTPKPSSERDKEGRPVDDPESDANPDDDLDVDLSADDDDEDE